MKILITGDLVINRKYKTLQQIDSSIKILFQESDYNIVNLEAPVTNSSIRINKTGPAIKADASSTLNVLEALKIDAVTLANNHVLDFDEHGVKDTLEFCQKHNIQTVGAGMNLKEASKTLYVDSEEGVIAIVNFAENEWASATTETAGANPMDLIDNLHQIQNAKQKADHVVVIVHGGHEHYNLPSPRMQKQYRFYAEQGADIIIGHHTHCISGNETYKGTPIYYGLGNFLFTTHSIEEDWYKGIVLEIEIKEEKLKAKVRFVQTEKNSFTLSMIKSKELEAILKRIEDYNTIIADPKLLKQEWVFFVDAKQKQYLDYWSPSSFIKNKYLQISLRKLGLARVNKTGVALFLNLMRCEAHRDLSEEVLHNYLEK